jgi:hypothetical protein
MAIEIKGKEYLVRELQTDDCMHLSLILDKTGFNINDYKKQVSGADKMEQSELENMGKEIAIQMGGYLIKNYHKAHKETKEFLASLIGVKPEEYAKMPINTPVKIVKELAKNNNLFDFFKQAVG